MRASSKSDKIAMSDSETPQPTPERDPAPNPSTAEPVNGSPQDGVQSPDQSSGVDSSSGEPQGTDDLTPSVPSPISSTQEPGRVKQLTRSRKGAWAAAAMLCIVAGTVGSVLGAHAVAHSDTTKTRVTFQQGSAAIASTLKLAIQRQEELTVAATTFFAANPKATHAEFTAWVTWARTRHRYPELDALDLMPAPPAPVPIHTHTTVNASSTSTEASPTSVDPASAPINASSDATPTPIDVSSPPVPSAPAPVHVPPALALARDTGLSVYTPEPAGRRSALAVETPVYPGSTVLRWGVVRG